MKANTHTHTQSSMLFICGLFEKIYNKQFVYESRKRERKKQYTYKKKENHFTHSWQHTTTTKCTKSNLKKCFKQFPRHDKEKTNNNNKEKGMKWKTKGEQKDVEADIVKHRKYIQKEP